MPYFDVIDAPSIRCHDNENSFILMLVTYHSNAPVCPRSNTHSVSENVQLISHIRLSSSKPLRNRYWIIYPNSVYKRTYSYGHAIAYARRTNKLSEHLSDRIGLLDNKYPTNETKKKKKGTERKEKKTKKIKKKKKKKKRKLDI